MKITLNLALLLWREKGDEVWLEALLTERW